MDVTCGRVAYFSRKNCCMDFDLHLQVLFSTAGEQRKNIVGHVVHSAVCNYPISNCGLGVLATNIFRTHCSTCPQKYQQSRSIPIINLHQINHNAMANHLLFQFKLEGECLTLASTLITLMYLMSLISTSAVEDLKQKSKSTQIIIPFWISTS